MSKSLEIFGLLLCQNLLPTPFKNCPIWSHCGTNLHRMFDTSTSQTEPYILLMYLRCTYFPVVHLLDGDSNPVVELHYDVGTTIEMVCRVRRPPLSHATVLWEVSKRRPRPHENDTNPNVVIVLNYDVSRGGIKIDTGRNASTGNLISRSVS